MTRYLALLLLAAAPALADQTAASCSQVDVQNAINAAVTGEKVIVPSGSCTWTAGITISNKGIHLQGPGYYGVSGTPPNWSDAGTWPLTITLSIPGGTSGIDVSSTNNGHRIEISGFEIGGSSEGGTANNGTIRILATNVADVVIHDNRFDATGSAIVNLASANPSVAYHNMHDGTGLVDTCSQANQVLVKDHSVDTNGDAAFIVQPGFGGANFFFVEDSTFLHNCTTGADVTAVTEGQAGGKLVFRYNNVRESGVGWHGSESGAPERGAYVFEVYNNILFWELPGDRYHTAALVRGGSARIHNNTVENYQSLVKFWTNRVGASFGRFNQCDGVQSHDGNTTPTGYPCLDQVGRTVASGTALSAVQPQTRDPVHLWSNARTNTPQVIDNNNPPGGYHTDGVDYEISDDATDRPPAYEPYTYPHPLRSDNRSNKWVFITAMLLAGVLGGALLASGMDLIGSTYGS